MFSSSNVYLKNSCIEFSVLGLITLCYFNTVYRNTITSFLVLSIKVCIYFKNTLNQAKNVRLNFEFTISKSILLFCHRFLLIYWIHILFVFRLIKHIFSKNIFFDNTSWWKGDDNCKKLNLFLRKIWQHSFYDIFHMCRCLQEDFRIKILTSSQQMCKTQTGEHLLCRFLLLFSPHVPSSPSFFVLRMVLNECTYTHPHVPSLFLMLQFASSNDR